MGSTPLSYLYRKNQASKLRGSASPHWLVLSNITVIKSTTLFGFLIDPCSTANGIIFFLDPSSGNNSEALQNPLFYYSEPDLNLLNKNSFYKCFFFFSGFFFFLSILLFYSLAPVPRWMWTSGCLSSFWTLNKTHQLAMSVSAESQYSLQEQSSTPEERL